MPPEVNLCTVPHLKGLLNGKNISGRQELGSMDSIHQAKVKSGHLLRKIALVQFQRNSTVISKQVGILRQQKLRLHLKLVLWFEI